MLTYSKIIWILKIAFFVSAISILAIVFIISPPDHFGEPVKVSTVGLEKNINYQISKAKLRGSSDSGHFFNFTVDSVNPDERSADSFSLTELAGTISINLRDVYTVSAKKALFSAKDKFVELTGNLRIQNNNGVTGKSEKIRIDFDSNEIVSLGPIRLQTPLGVIRGGSMRISNSQTTGKKATKIYFFDGVHMLLTVHEL
tara:strand:+ start:840 stop:1439 length:600 start_codon:yes stop_codon:yes gene_type:complete